VNLSYFPRLICLCLASFFFVNLFFDLAVCCTTGAALRIARRLGPHNGARFLFALRLAPCGLALCIVACLCIPSYLRMEPGSIDEPVGWLCLASAMLFSAVLTISGARGLGAIIRSSQYVRRLQSHGRLVQIPGEGLPVWVIDGREPLIALAGILRPRLILSRQVMDALSTEELASALQHERAHRISHDNLKRLAMLLTPAFPPARVLRRLESAWARHAEWAADDIACGGSAQHSLSLATALVKVMRIDATPQATPELLTALVSSIEDLSVRVERLLRTHSPDEASRKRSPYVTAGCALLAAFAGFAILRPETQLFVHEVLERLIH
jgi:hypothetical protein